MQEDQKETKKILIFSTAYYPFVGGAEVAIRELTDRMPGIQFDLITAKMKKGLPFREKIGNVTVYRLGVGIPLIDKLISPFEAAFFARHLVKKKAYKAFWCMMVSYSPWGAYIYNLLFSPKVPVVLTLQEGDSEKYLKTKWFGLIDFSWKFVLKRTETLTVISNYLGNRAKRFGFQGEIKLIPNGVNIEKFSREISEEERRGIRDKWGIKDGDTLLITSSRLNVKNGVGDVIKSLSFLADNIKFIIFGAGELEKELKKLTIDLHLENRVIFGGLASQDILPKYLKASDIFVRPSLSEGQGISFLEAMAAKIPVIATPVGGIVDFLHDSEMGYMCKPEDPKSIAEAVSVIIQDDNKNKVVENAFNLVKEKYDWDNISVQMKAVFDRMTR